ncbi:hypothetical protein C9374_008920 [Naegleria lovaniensis]|uniref:Uncharacterized protein n=1 Tax=Naegleria lovaniensis TaxID=51637 RepID=A0AA88GIR4_NAELO|nr:uncharacterized protein C9374_008920 [Naegleria lovaniensis]KAG2377835.1 hypothetical protein C9374_008920 [Naegleria lovaniensis]
MKPTSSSTNNTNNTISSSSSNNAPISYPELLNILNAEHQSSVLLHESSADANVHQHSSTMLPSSSSSTTSTTNAANHLFHSLFAAHHQPSSPSQSTTTQSARVEQQPSTPLSSLSTTQLLLDELSHQQQVLSPFHPLSTSGAMVDPYLYRLYQLGQQQQRVAALMSQSSPTTTPSNLSLLDPTAAAAVLLQQQQQQQQALLNSVALAQQLTSSLMMKSAAAATSQKVPQSSVSSQSIMESNKKNDQTTTIEKRSKASSDALVSNNTTMANTTANTTATNTTTTTTSSSSTTIGGASSLKNDHSATTSAVNHDLEEILEEHSQESRHWSTVYIHPQLALDSTQVNIYLETRDSGPRLDSTVDSELYSSIKYEMRHEIKELNTVFNGEASDDLQLFCRIQIIHPDNKTEVLKNGKPILGGVIESNVSRSNSDNSMTSMKIKFTDCSYHHGNCKFAFRVSYFIESDLDNPILIMESAPFKVLARKPSKNKKPAQKRKKEEEEEATINAITVDSPPPSQKIKISNFEDFKQVTASVFDYIQSASDEQKKRQMINHVVTKLYSVDPNMMFSLPSDDGANDIFKGLL